MFFQADTRKTLSMPKFPPAEVGLLSPNHAASNLLGESDAKNYFKLSASVPVYSKRLFLDTSEDVDDVIPYLKTATPCTT